MADRFGKFPPVLDSIALDGFPASANSANVFSQPTRSIYVGGTGNVEVMMLGYNGSNTVLLFAGVPAGTLLPIRAQAVTGNTTATSIVCLY